MTDKFETTGFTDAQAIWEECWPKLRSDVDSLILTAFRLLVFHLNQHDFFSQPSMNILKIIEGARGEAPPELSTVRRIKEPNWIPIFADSVSRLLKSGDLTSAAMFAFVIDFQLGRELSKALGRGERTGLQKAMRAVNGANRILMDHPSETRPLILVRSSARYWSKRQSAVSQFPLRPQGTMTYFDYLIPTASSVRGVQYSALGSPLPAKKLNVALWPLKAPSIRSRAIRRMQPKEGELPFHFKRWDNLPKKHRQEQRAFADLIENYILHVASDELNAVHIIAAPELTLAPESLDSMIRAIESRRNAAWILFPGSYHIKLPDGFINQAPIYVGGKLRPIDLSEALGFVNKVAVKRFPVVFRQERHDLVEHIDGRQALTHVLDTSVGRLAVMICFDFLTNHLRHEILTMEVDHLFVLSMSPDSARKFKTGMDNASDSRTGCFFVNAFFESNPNRRAAHRRPLKGARINWMRKTNTRPYFRIVLKS